jgi:hypothetical protein
MCRWLCSVHLYVFYDKEINSLIGLLQIGYRNSLENLSNKHAFCENQRSESHTFLPRCVNWYPSFPRLFSYLGSSQYKHSTHDAVGHNEFRVVGVGKAVLSLWLSMQLHLRVYREPVWHFYIASARWSLFTMSRIIYVLHGLSVH